MTDVVSKKLVTVLFHRDKRERQIETDVAKEKRKMVKRECSLR